MNKGTALAVALGSGYLLGRTKKLRLALMVGGAIATGKAGSVGAGLVKRGVAGATKNTDLGGLSPALGEISGALKGNLADAAKAATMAAVTSRANALADRISDQAEALRSGGPAGQQSRDDHEGDDAQDRSDGTSEARGKRDADDRRQTSARRSAADDSGTADNGRHNGRAKGSTKRSDQRQRSDQQKPRGNGRTRSSADDDQRARRHSER